MLVSVYQKSINKRQIGIKVGSIVLLLGTNDIIILLLLTRDTTYIVTVRPLRVQI